MSKVIFNGIELNGTQALPELTYAEYDALPVKPEYWILKDDALSEDYVEVVADGSKTYTDTLNDFYGVVDASRLCENSKIVFTKPNGTEYIVALTCVYTNALLFTGTQEYAANTLYYRVIKLSASYSFMDERSNNSDTVYESQTVPSGTKIRLYYNTATLGQINTKAENCIYGNGNVKDALDALDDSRKAFIVGKEVTVNASVTSQNDLAVSCTVPTGYIPLCVLASSYMIDQGYMGAPSYVTSGTTKARWKNLTYSTVTLTNQVCVFYFVKYEITVS